MFPNWVIHMKTFASQIHRAVRDGVLSEPFDAAMVRSACPGWADHTYNTFLGKHSVGNGKTSELFVKVRRGLYKLRDPFALQKGILKFEGKVKWDGDLDQMRLD